MTAQPEVPSTNGSAVPWFANRSPARWVAAMQTFGESGYGARCVTFEGGVSVCAV